MFSQFVPRPDKGGPGSRTRPFQSNTNEASNERKHRPFSIFSVNSSAQRANQGAYILPSTSNYSTTVRRAASSSRIEPNSSNTAAEASESPDASPEPEHPAERGLFANSTCSKTSGLSLFSKTSDPNKGGSFTNQEARSSSPTQAQPTHLQAEAMIHHSDPSSYHQDSISPMPKALDDADRRMADLILKQSRIELQNSMAEATDLKRELASTRSQLEVKKNENINLTSRLAASKKAAIQSIKSASQKIEALESDLKCLFTESTKVFQVADDMRSFYQETRESVSAANEARHAFESLLNEDGNYAEGVRTKELIHELYQEITNSQEVSAMLRSKLETMGCELVDARSFSQDLNTLLITEKKTSVHMSANLAKTAEQLENIRAAQEKLQRECVEALLKAAEADEEIITLKKRISELIATNGEKDIRIDELISSHDECITLRSQLEQAKKSLEELPTLRNELNNKINVIGEINGQLHLLENGQFEYTAKLRETEERLLRSETQLEELRCLERILRDEVSEHTSREQAALIRETQALSEVRSLESNRQSLGKDLEKVTADLEALRCKDSDIQASLVEAKAREHAALQRQEKLDEQFRIANERLAQVSAESEKMKLELAENSATERSLREEIVRQQQAMTAQEEMSRVKLDNLNDEVERLNDQVTKDNDKIETMTSSLQAWKTKHEILQDQYDDQGISLRASKQMCADLQEKMTNNEATYGRMMEEQAGKLALESAKAQKDRDFFNYQVADLSKKLEEAEERVIADRTRQEALSTEKDLDYQAHLEAQQQKILAEQRQALLLESKLNDCSLTVEALRIQLATSEAKLSEEIERRRLQSESTSPNVSCTPSYPDQRQLVASLTSANERLNATVKNFEEQKKTLLSRHKAGILDEDETAFAASLINMTRSLHEQESVTRENEIRRRDNVIKGLQQKIATLEGVLARRIANRREHTKQSTEDYPDRHSIVNSESWMQSHGGFFPESCNSDIPLPPSVVGLEALPRKIVSSTTTGTITTHPKDVPAPPKEVPHEEKSSFAELNRQCDDTETSNSYLGKRERSTSQDSFKEAIKPEPVTERSRPTRRIRNSLATRNETQKTNTNSGKTKSRKRKQ